MAKSEEKENKVKKAKKLVDKKAKKKANENTICDDKAFNERPKQTL